MHKLLISTYLLATLITLSACGSLNIAGEAIPNALDRLPLVYRPTIQQGNVIEQADINKLKPGMSKRQVNFVLGSPMLADTFHENRWDYYYRVQTGRTLEAENHIVLEFDNDRLIKISGDFRPQADAPEVRKEIVVDVPDYEPEKKTLFGRILSTVGVEGVGN